MDWRPPKQKLVATSSVEDEYVALSGAGQQCMYLCHPISSVGWEHNGSTVIFGDHLGALRLAHSKRYHPRTKNIGIKYHYVRYNLMRDNQVSAHR